MKTDIEIAQSADVWPIEKIASQVGLKPEEWEPYGRDKAKVQLSEQSQENKLGKLILVTSINPTPAGEGKSTVTVGLADALMHQKHKTMVALREPSLGPVMGLKGGATGGGYSQVVPMADINMHFTGDFHALTSAHNTLAALIDNSLYQGNPLNLDPRRILWKRALDVNDRALRHVTIGLGGPTSGVPREDGFDITVASELMAILTLSHDLTDMKQRISKIVIGYTYDKNPVTVADLGVAGAITTLLKDAIKPNLVQTLAHTPALIHGGPFANIAQGTNSILATKTALQLSDYVVTEAGFGADLGGEKFLDFKAPLLGKVPDTIVIVATVRALKMHGGEDKQNLKTPNLSALKLGLVNLGQHIKSMKRYGVPVVVAINQFTHDTKEELALVNDYAKSLGVEAYVADVWGQGGLGAQDLATGVVQATEQAESQNFQPLYQPEDEAIVKINHIVQEIYGGDKAVLSGKAEKQLATFKKYGWDKLPIIMAKTQNSLTDDSKRIGAPKNFDIHIREFIPKLGAGFLVALTGSILTMPGLPKHPAALDIDIASDGQITGLN
ncbi:formate--tetrahydrofolate ligase [Weissella paramesenteroides]|jgi:formate--tetrahydrofolate ligase|uniref:Formate--tetrahydrofolate ligase n=1 Tax=Weissella paramesenteroides TaxID=1249 RepID=A0ABD4XJ60_WEIPA|nr:formate--tetrahydrofolate ligase [Weissella paramesenteroides]MCT0485447.1 formate--tetrahydrofolate ligase [Weissella paramesenteroides]MDF8367162.1 formate--tetrahydrofolate ligase [Weissella paramesenteroides]MDF8369198.1 formate--tetrahydrofolate ligase [Weissella paramesenteroides]MDF8371211.1 formate--tetrahydrofolate ligase [Weissella paramesenteroides]MDF8373705.1 formate--tetrahydrofolate ligase [Weissella paramesenteroides]